MIMATARRPRRRPRLGRGLIGLLVGLGMVGMFAAVATEANLPVMLPMFAAAASLWLFLWVLWGRERTVPFFEIGVVYAGVVALYTLYPLAGYLAIGQTYGPFNDNRLFVGQPAAAEIGRLGWYDVAHQVSFLVAYLLMRGRVPGPSARFERPGRLTLYVLLGLYALISVYFVWLDWVFNLSAGTYSESYLAFGRLPPGIAQLTGLLVGARFTIALMILAVLFCHVRRYWPLVLLWLGWVMGVTLLRLGNRTELILLLVAAAMLYHHLVHPIPLVALGVGALAGLSLFVALGLLRMGWLFGGLTPDGGVNPFHYASEFEVIFANAYDLDQRRTAGDIGPLPIGFYLTDLAISVPRQLLPFEKVTPAEWYVNTYYPVFASWGGGLAFGTVSESIMGWGVPDVVGRGAALGVILALVHRYIARRRPSFWGVVFYIWLATQLYQSFRNTTFLPFYLFLYRFAWVAVGVEFLTRALRGSLRPRGGGPVGRLS